MRFSFFCLQILLYRSTYFQVSYTNLRHFLFRHRLRIESIKTTDLSQTPAPCQQTLETYASQFKVRFSQHNNAFTIRQWQLWMHYTAVVKLLNVIKFSLNETFISENFNSNTHDFFTDTMFQLLKTIIVN